MLRAPRADAQVFIMSFIVFVVMRAMDRVFSKRVVDRMANYQLMYFNILWPIGVQVAQVAMCLAWVWYQRFSLRDLRYDLSFFLPHASIATIAGGAYPQWRLALFSFWDQLNAVVTGIPGPYISQNDQGISACASQRTRLAPCCPPPAVIPH